MFYEIGATELKAGRPSLEMSVIQHNPQWSSRKRDSFKRTVPTPFFSWGSSKESSGAPCHKCQRGNKAQQGRDSAELPSCAAKKKGDGPHRAFREASAEVTGPTLYLFLDSPPQRAIPSPRGTDKAALPVTAHRRVCPSHPTREQSDFACCSHHKEGCDCCLQVHREGEKAGKQEGCYMLPWNVKSKLL